MFDQRAFPTDWELSRMALAEECHRMRNEFENDHPPVDRTDGNPDFIVDNPND